MYGQVGSFVSFLVCAAGGGSTKVVVWATHISNQSRRLASLALAS